MLLRQGEAQNTEEDSRQCFLEFVKLVCLVLTDERLMEWGNKFNKHVSAWKIVFFNEILHTKD